MSGEPGASASSTPSGAAAHATPGRAVASATPSAAGAAPPRELEPGTILIPEVNTAIVSRGDSLWRISHRIYGQGLRYTVIYDANQEQIRNPDLIYPGQVFVLPSGSEPPSASR